MESIYFSKENFKRIYKILNTNFKKNFNFSIKRRPEYRQKIIDIMKFVYSKRHTYDIPDNLSDENKSIYLTQKLINIIIFYESKNHITPESEANIISPTVNQVSSLRPQVMSNQDNNNIENNLNALLESRKSAPQDVKEIDFTLSTSEFNKVNIQDRYSEITKLRETEYDNFSRPPNTEPEMRENEKNLFENMNMDADNIDLENVLGDYQMMNNLEEDRPNNLQTHYANLESPTKIDGVLSGQNSTSLASVNSLITDNRLLIETIKESEQKDRSYIKYHTVVIDCGSQLSNSKPRVVEFKDVTDVSGAPFASRLSNTNGGALIRDGWSNVVSVEIKRIIIPNKTDLPYLFLTTDSLPSNITPSESLPQDIFAILYHDTSSTSYSHYINTDKHVQTFEQPTEVFMNKIRLNIETETPEDVDWTKLTHSIHVKPCKLFLNIGIKVDHKFDN